MKPVKVLIVDDSALVRKVLTRELGKEPDLEIVGAAPDPYVARELIVAQTPDVIVLDIEMPRMDGLTFLRVLMKHHPIPVVILSSIATEGGRVAMSALEAGAVEVMCKPGGSYSVGEIGEQLGDKVRAAARAGTPRPPVKAIRPAPHVPNTRSVLDVIAIGSSTGGPEALRAVLTELPNDLPGIVIAQHMPKAFTKHFAERLDEVCALEVREATDGETIRPGLALLAPGDEHMIVQRGEGMDRVRLHQGEKVHHQRPAVDLLFHSVARSYGRRALGVILTGMGKDGAEGLLAMRKAGAATLGQDEKSCVVYGMPRVAAEAGAVEHVLGLEHMPKGIVDACFAPARSGV